MEQSKAGTVSPLRLGPEDIRNVRVSEMAGENAIPHQACNATEQDACRHEHCLVAHACPPGRFQIPISRR
jgi:hypothetical protein